MFRQFVYKIDLITEPFENLKYRDRTVLIVCKDGEGNYLLGAKTAFFPKGIVRLLGGGVDDGEDVINAAVREIKEETNVDAEASDFIELAEVQIVANYLGKIYNHSVFTCFLNFAKDDYLADDDVEDIVKYSEEDYRALIQRYSEIRADNIYHNDRGTTFSWGDYGKVYGFIHQVALDEVLSRGL